MQKPNQPISETAQRHIDLIATINAVATVISLSPDLDTILQRALQSVVDAVDAEATGISLIDERTEEIVLRAQIGWLQDMTSGTFRIPLGTGFSGYVIQENRAIVENDLDGEESYAVPSFRDEHFRSLAMAPMHGGGKTIGILSVMSHQPHQFDDAFANVLQAIADTVGIAVENARLYGKHVEHENQLAAILQATADGIIATDQDGKIREINHAAESMLEISSSDLIGIPLRTAAIPPRIRDLLLLSLISREAGENKSFQVTLESGRVLSVLVTIVNAKHPVHQPNKTDGWVIVLQDVTHVREAEIARAQFIRTAAHDMRNPLNVTQTSIRLLEKMIEHKTDDVNEVIDIAYTGIDRLKRLIDDLLLIEKIESGYEFHLTDVDFREMCWEIGANFQQRFAEKSQTYHFAFNDNVPQTIKVDRNWVRQAIEQYLTNACTFTLVGSTISLSIYSQPPMLHVEVIDDCAGIRASDQRRLFERFYRVPGTEEIGGSGLGLAIVKSIAEAHGGNVYVRSKLNSGSTFGFTLPLAQENTVEAPQ